MIFNKSEILINLTVADTIWYVTPKAEITFIYLRQMFIKLLIF